jgi:alcohol dehydrogenase class IV
MLELTIVLLLWLRQEEDYHKIVELSAKSSSMQGNPIKLSHAELLEVLKKAV